MLSGRDALGRLSNGLNTARNELAALNRQVQITSTMIASNDRRRAQSYRHLAETRLDAVQRGEVVARLDSADRRVSQILEQREGAIARITKQIGDAFAELEVLEKRRNSLHDEVDAAAKILAEREAAVQSSLESDADFEQQLERTRRADAVAVSAQEKAELAVADRQEKGKPFESDALFMYLWQRHYGTSEYRANPLARLLDAWVARLCKYKDARPNYWMLLEIPKRLKDHAGYERDKADDELEQLQELEQQAAQAGGVPDAAATLTEAEQRQDDLDAQIEASEKQLDTLQSEQGQFAAGDDPFSKQCVDVYTEVMERQDISDLTRLARATMTVADDSIVEELRDLRRQDDDLRDELRQNRALQQEHMRRVRELEEVRREFKRHRYDDLRSGFDNGDLIGRMIGEVLRGAIKGGALWDVLRRYQRYNDVAGEWPDFGSGGITRPRRQRRQRRRAKRPSSWHWPGTRRSGLPGGFKLPKASPRSPRGRGGFRTGGGF